MKWKEQVDLPNNETIIVARTATMAGNWIAGGGGGSINKRMTVKMGVQRLGRDHFFAICFPDIRCRNF